MLGLYSYWIVSYDANGVPYWTLTGFPLNLVNPPNPTKPDGDNDDKPEDNDDKPDTFRIRMGKWEEIYDVVDGTKSWYNTVTSKTTKKDPFW